MEDSSDTVPIYSRKVVLQKEEEEEEDYVMIEKLA